MRLKYNVDNYNKRQRNINCTLTDYVITTTTAYKSNETTTQILRLMYFAVVYLYLNIIKLAVQNPQDL